MTTFPDGNGGPPSLSREYPSEAVTMDLTMCGLLVERAAELALLYQQHGNWNEVKDVWFEERRAERSTRGSSQKIYRVLTSRLKNAPAALPNPKDLPAVFDLCSRPTDKAQVLYLYLLADDVLVRYVVHECVQRMLSDTLDALDFSNESLKPVLDTLEYTDGESFDYADSTTERWCEGFRSVLREIGALEQQETVIEAPPSLGDVPLLVAMAYSYEMGGDDWIEAPLGLQYLFQPQDRWEELYDRVAETDSWTFSEIHGTLQLQPVSDPYDWIDREVRS
jgi:hypothetical protein